MITVAGEGGAQAAVAELSTVWGVLALIISSKQSYHHCRASPQPPAPTHRQWVMDRDEPPRGAALVGYLHSPGEGAHLKA